MWTNGSLLFAWFLFCFFVSLVFDGFFSFVFCFCIFDYLLLNWFLSKRERVGCGVCKFKFNLDKPEYKNEIKNIALIFFIIIMKISYLILKLHRVFFPHKLIALEKRNNRSSKWGKNDESFPCNYGIVIKHTNSIPS